MTKKIGLLLSGLFFLSTTQAALHLELTQGVNASIPISIVAFAGQANNVPGNTTLSQVISNDLQFSGQFNVIAPPDQPTQVSQINRGNFQNKGVNDVVIGQVKPMGPSRYEVSFQLVDLSSQSNPMNTQVTAAQPSVSPGAVLLNQSFTADQGALRALAHHISDLIYQKLTGVRGVFSTKIAYVLAQRAVGRASRYELIVADEDGFAPRVLFTSGQPIMSPTWSPSGHELAYVSFEGYHAAIYIQNVATGARKLISRYPGINNSPAFSPNGKRMAMVLTPNNGNPNIYVMNLATKQLTKITNDSAINTEPTWSSDGNSLLYTSDQGGGPQIYRYDFATGQSSRITFDGNYNARACFTSTMNSIVLLHRDGGSYDIAKQNLTTGRMTILTTGGSDDSPSLAPNGKMVLYGTRFNDKQVLGLVSIDGRVKLRLPSQEGDVQDPSWSPYL